MPCSFCHIIGHSIQRCNSPEIEVHYDTIRTFYENTCHHLRHTTFGRTLFFNYVNINFDEIILKAIALKYISIYIFSRRTFSKEKIIKKIWKLQFRDSIISVISPPNQTTLNQYFEPVSPLPWTIDRTTTQTEQPLYELLYNPTNLMQQFDSVVSSIKKYDMTISLEEEAEEEEKEEEDCGICYELTNDINNVHLECGHKFCGQCIKGCLNVGKIACPMCRCPIKNMTVKNVDIYDLVSEYCK